MPEQHSTEHDKNFDDLTHHFKRNIYDSLKGQIRLAVIERDLAPYLRDITPQNTDEHCPKVIADVGGGQGQFSLALAKQGHHVTLCDISQEMLKLAENKIQTMDITTAKLLHCSLQQLPTQLDVPADIVLCHALLEWMAKPEEAMRYIHQCLKPGGILSLAFFNIHSIVYKNLLRGNFRKVESGNFVGQAGSLTPINPLAIENVLQWCAENNLEVLEYSGIRVFHDYIARPELRTHAPEALLELELRFSKEEPYRNLARYIHLIARKAS